LKRRQRVKAGRPVDLQARDAEDQQAREQHQEQQLPGRGRSVDAGPQQEGGAQALGDPAP
jgi:hypothetical protein